ncbi:ATP-dependent helicase HrpB [Chryseosolibacter indicus]|uniref:ATP-dependent helicase HrpB n=1 Tax=Chryseosolibacter indicus TaxID=2782351 RepID=A0ABS5VSZ7_9BACT|nr:ATP-dependent helicase HrpB [Chryseosolibacter indicus]MBT1703894.1 ATP-dependent helicase HrpB [Chryseosolibacter indicus]
MSYPVLEITDQLRQQLQKNNIVILQAPPGAGKSTVLPLQLINEQWLSNNKIVMLEPRRLAARSVALRMASILNDEVGKTIGYRVRFDSKVSDVTKIEVVTEGILTRIIQQDNVLDGIGLIIFDEFHERSLQADTALALSIQVQQVLRPDLRILIMSATLDSEKLSATLNNAPIVTSTGKQFPVEQKYFPAESNTHLIPHVVRTIRKAYHEHSGDILVFLPGAGEINRTMASLENENFDAVVYPLFGDLPYRKQQEAILPDPAGKRKIVLSTSIAETSLTIEGIAIVIDSGLSRVPKFDPRSGFTRLQTVRVTRDAADQRTGRAGRLGPGLCYRLWSEAIQNNLLPQRVPEILEADLAPLMLELAVWGVKDTNELIWITPPPAGAASQAKEILRQLEALHDNKITAKGREMTKLPTHPRIAHMLLQASEIETEKAVAVATDIAALLEEKDPMDKEVGVDLSLRVEMLRRWRALERVNADVSVLDRIEKLAAAWRRLMKVKEDNTRVEDTLVGRLVFSAYPERLAKQVDKNGRYKLTNGRTAKLHDNDPIARETFLAIADLDAGSGEGKIYLAAPVDVYDLLILSEERKTVRWDEDRGMITGTIENTIGNISLLTKPLPKIPDDLRIKELCKVVQQKGLQMLGWDDTHEAWQSRVLSLKKWRPEEEWPDVSSANLLSTIEDWLTPFLTSVNKATELLKLDLSAILSTLIPWNLSSKLDALAPSKLPVPSGSMISVNYFSDDRPPVMEVRLQEVFGLVDTPTVNEGRVKVILHLLSPGYKPVQVTQDLKSFWTNTYAEVRKELRTRYPKHSWPEDPWTAQAVRGAKKRV